jgi:hypothetical protein
MRGILRGALYPWFYVSLHAQLVSHTSTVQMIAGAGHPRPTIQPGVPASYIKIAIDELIQTRI